MFVTALKPPNKWTGEWHLTKKTDKPFEIFNRPPSDRGVADLSVINMGTMRPFNRFLSVTLKADQYVDSPTWSFEFDFEQLKFDPSLNRLAARFELQSGLSSKAPLINWPYLTMSFPVRLSLINLTIDLPANTPIDFAKQSSIDPRRESITFKISVEPRNSSLYEIVIKPTKVVAEEQNYSGLILLAVGLLALALFHLFQRWRSDFHAHEGFSHNIGVEVHYLMMFNHLFILRLLVSVFYLKHSSFLYQLASLMALQTVHLAIHVKKTHELYGETNRRYAETYFNH